MEALYYGKVLIGHPLGGDQIGACYRVERLGVGISLRKNPSSQLIFDTIKRVLPRENEVNAFQDKMEKVRRQIHFKELRSGQDLVFHLHRAIKYDEWSGGQSAKHLFQASVRDNSFFTVYDYDIKLELLALAIVTALFFKGSVAKLIK